MISKEGKVTALRQFDAAWYHLFYFRAIKKPPLKEAFFLYYFYVFSVPFMLIMNILNKFGHLFLRHNKLMHPRNAALHLL